MKQKKQTKKKVPIIITDQKGNKKNIVEIIEAVVQPKKCLACGQDANNEIHKRMFEHFNPRPEPFVRTDWKQQEEIIQHRGAFSAEPPCEDWEEEFRIVYNQSPAFNDTKAIKILTDFIRHEISKARQEEREKCKNCFTQGFNQGMDTTKYMLAEKIGKMKRWVATIRRNGKTKDEYVVLDEELKSILNSK